MKDSDKNNDEVAFVNNLNNTSYTNNEIQEEKVENDTCNNLDEDNIKDNNKKKYKRASIGGQAVMEGVMMRGVSSMAVAVRDEEGIIRVHSERFKSGKKKNVFLKIPIIRGIINFFMMMFIGTKTLSKSAEVFGESEPTKFELWIEKKFKINPMNIIIVIGMLLGLGLSILLFFVLPSIITVNLFKGVFGWEFTNLTSNLIEGGIRLLIFIVYILLVSLMKDIRRTFMYHGAEHRTINCYEKGLDLTVENVQSCSTVHNRCGTTFMFFVMIVSIIVFSITESALLRFGIVIDASWQKVVVRLIMLPLVAGLSYELLKLLALTDFFLLYPLKAPGLLLQLLTTKKPDDKMAEVALVAFKKVMELDEDENAQTTTFEKPKKIKDFKKENIEKLSDESELDWILCEVLDCKRDEIEKKTMLTISQVEKAKDLIEKVQAGMPLQYAIGHTEFFGYKIQVDSNVLIPRFDTEILAEQVIKFAKNDSEVLDVCTGSGCIAIAINKRLNNNVTAVDISEDALIVARKNQKLNNANVTFEQSDMFNNLDSSKKYDVIVSNPPYIKSEDIKTLDSVVSSNEPVLALDGGESGLDFYKIIAEKAFNYLKEDGAIFLEVGIDQAQEVKKLFEGKNVEIIKDFNQIDRVLKITNIIAEAEAKNA